MLEEKPSNIKKENKELEFSKASPMVGDLVGAFPCSGEGVRRTDEVG